jgi:hypothetical protein
MSIHLATIVHVTDMHLEVTAEGTLRPPHERAASLRLLSRLGWTPRGMEVHNQAVLEEFEKVLKGLVAAHKNDHPTVPFIVMQTGDMEAYGANYCDRDKPYNAFDYWDRLKRTLGSGIHFIDQYGNHDIWPGTQPVLAVPTQQWALQALKDRIEFRGPLPDHQRVATAAFPIDIYRLNTVHAGLVGAVLAHGKVTRHFPVGQECYPVSGGTDPLKELEALVLRTSKPAIQILVAHHPPEYFATRSGFGALYDRNTTGQFAAAAELLHLLTALNFHIVLAGHRHVVFPSRASLKRPTPPRQLVANSPTQAEPGERSFSVYHLLIDGKLLTIDRTIHAWDPAHNQVGVQFKPSPRLRLPALQV